MQSSALRQQIAAIFGTDGEARLARGLEALGKTAPEFVAGLQSLLAGADAACAQYARIQRTQAELGGDVLSEWDLPAGRIASGRQWKPFLGYADEALADTLAAWQSLLHPDDLPAVRAALARHVRGEAPLFAVESRMRTAGGAWRWLSLKGKVLAWGESGEALRMLVLHRDISARRANEAALIAAKEAAEAASRARAAFLANVSHEIRTPLNAVIGMTELTLDTSLDSEQRHYLKTVKASAEALLALLNDILDFSKIEAGKLRFEQIAFSPAEVLFEAARTMAVSAHAKGLELIADVDPDVPEKVVGDPTRLRQVFINLLGNAIKFTENGEVEARIALERQGEASIQLRAWVRDTGIGIEKARQQEIFEAFTQADSSTTRRFGGTGLGLAISARLVQMMDGRFELDSAPGQGSRFTFTARFGRDATPAAPPADVAEAWRPAGDETPRALVLDPCATAAATLVRQLQDLGFAASSVADWKAARAALEKARALGFSYHFLFAAADMPAPAGLALLTRWLAEAPVEKLVLLLSHQHARDGLADLQARGLGCGLMKPVSREDLRAVLTLCQAAKTGAPEQPLAPAGLSETSSARPLRILVVEDNPVNLELARRLLEKLGHTVSVAQHGGEAVECFERQVFDVILMDMQMPVLGGIEATEAIRARELRRSWVVSGEFRPVFIAAMTANAMPGDRERCLAAGMNDYLSKPLRPEALRRVLDAAAALRRAPVGAPPDREAAGTESALPSAAALLADAIVDFPAAERDLGDAELVRQMARMLLEEWPQHQAALTENLAARQASELCRAAHTLKGLLAIFHADASSRAALRLERLCRAETPDWNEIVAQHAFLNGELERVRPELERYVGLP